MRANHPHICSYNFNYGQAGSALGLDLLGNPDLVTSSAVVAFRTGKHAEPGRCWPPVGCATDAHLGMQLCRGENGDKGWELGVMSNALNAAVPCAAAALWFWMTPQPPKPSAHDVMTGR